MITKKYAPLFIALTLALAPQAMAVTASGTAKANVIRNITITEDQILDFGKFAPGLTGGTVRVFANGSSNSSGDVNVIDPANPGIFAVTGEPNEFFQINTTSSNVTLTRVGGSQTMTSVLETADAANNPINGRTLNGSGTANVYVQGVLTVSAAQAAGRYEGTYSVSVDY
jgi:hypothetical protein